MKNNLNIEYKYKKKCIKCGENYGSDYLFDVQVCPDCNRKIHKFKEYRK